MAARAGDEPGGAREDHEGQRDHPQRGRRDRGHDAQHHPHHAEQYAQQAIPFVDFGNKYAISSVSYAYQLLQGRTWSQIAAALSDPPNPIAQGAVGSANMITAAICKITNDQPAAVCDAAPVTALKSQL